MNKKINIGLVGFGLGGQTFHAPFITSVEELHLHSIVTNSEERRSIAKERYPSTQIVSTIEELLLNEDIDLVVITIPNKFHYETVEKALLAHKHVVVDKPFTITSEEADQLIDLAQHQKKLLSVFHNRRLDSDFLTVSKVINEGHLGTLVEYEAHFDRFRPTLKPNAWREEEEAGSGILYDLGSHLIDQALQLFGMPKEVYADLRIQREGAKVNDYFELILNYGKLKVSLFSGMLVKELGPHFILKGDRGAFIKYGMDPQEVLLKQGIYPQDVDNWGEEKEEEWGILTIEQDGVTTRQRVKSDRGDYRRYYHNVAQAIRGKESLHVKPEEARDVIRIIEVALKSSEEKRVIKL